MRCLSHLANTTGYAWDVFCCLIQEDRRWIAMVLMAITGNLGSGKTLSLTYLAYRNLLKGMKIYSNYHLKMPYTHVGTVKQLDRMTQGFFAGDESWLVFQLTVYSGAGWILVCQAAKGIVLWTRYFSLHAKEVCISHIRHKASGRQTFASARLQILLQFRAFHRITDGADW